MARFDKSSTKRPKQNAAVAATRGAKRSTAPSIEDTMFFPRLRRHAKWMFVFLAVALGGGFVLFGVGAGGTGVGDLFRGRRRLERRAVDLERRRRRPRRTRRTSQAWRDLSTALQTDGQTDEAIDAQKHVVVLTPKDADAPPRARRPLPRAGDREAAGGAARPARRPRTPGAGAELPRCARRRTGQSLVDDQISQRSTRRARRRSRSSLSEAQSASSAGGRGLQADRRAAAERPERPARARPGGPAGGERHRRRSRPTAAFLKLAPDDPNAPIVKQQLKQLRQTAAVVGIDSRRSGALRRPDLRAGPRLVARCAVAVVAGRPLAAGCGSAPSATRRAPATGPTARSCSSRTAAAAIRSPTPARRARSARISTTRSSSRARDGLGESDDRPGRARPDRVPVENPSTGAPGHAGEHRRGPGRGRRRELRRRASPASATRTSSQARRRTTPAPSTASRRRAVAPTCRRQGGLRVGRLRELPHARRRRLDRHRRPESRRRQARRGARRRRAVTNGKAPMPSFKGQLSTTQIAAVATYVSSVAGK